MLFAPPGWSADGASLTTPQMRAQQAAGASTAPPSPDRQPAK